MTNVRSTEMLGGSGVKKRIENGRSIIGKNCRVGSPQVGGKSKSRVFFGNQRSPPIPAQIHADGVALVDLRA